MSTAVEPPKREPVSATLRNAVWIKYMGDVLASGKCTCCGYESISRANFEVGHVVAHARGGTTHIDNLRPICSLCNSSMGTRDMFAFMAKVGFALPGSPTGKEEVAPLLPASRPAPSFTVPVEAPLNNPGAPLFHYSDGSVLARRLASWLVNVPTYEGNRLLDPAHVDNLMAEVTDCRQLQGPYTVMTCIGSTGEPEDFRIFDGQHRAEVLRRKLTTDFFLLARIYTLNSYAEGMPIFRQINNSMPISLSERDVVEKVHGHVSILQQTFRSPRRCCVRSNTMRPYMSSEKLIQALRANTTWLNRPSSELAAHAIKANDHYSENPVARIPGRQTTKLWNRAVELGFYLGLDTAFAWLNLEL